jgi:hypothetical protein
MAAPANGAKLGDILLNHGQFITGSMPLRLLVSEVPARRRAKR